MKKDSDIKMNLSPEGKFIDISLEVFFRLKIEQKHALRTLGLKTVGDILYYFPKKYNESFAGTTIENAKVSDQGTQLSLYGMLSDIKIGKTFKGNVPMASAILTDGTEKIKLTWMRQPYLAKTLHAGGLYKVTGKISITKTTGIANMINPRIEAISAIPTHIGSPLFAKPKSELKLDYGNETTYEVPDICIPTYAETKHLSSLWLYHNIKKIIADPRFDEIEDIIPEPIRAKYHLPHIKTALIWIHDPHKKSDAEIARKRFAFEEIFLIQLRAEQEKAYSAREKSFVIKNDVSVQDFIDRLGFTPTEDQMKAVSDILKDMQRDHPMSRLIEGDVGSGKTAVAAIASYAVVTERPKNQNFGTLQVAYMAPTEILAKQHFESFMKLFRHMPISIGLITGSECRKFPSKLKPGESTHISRSQLTKWVKNGEISIIIGTHALIQKNVEFKHLALVIIDEQHRFGTNQRQKLAKKHERIPHLLSMTATPIPRTLALTLYGDLDISIIGQMPSGRKPIITKISTPAQYDDVYAHIRQELDSGRQAYIICPRIDIPDEDLFQELSNKDRKKGISAPKQSETMKSVIGEARRLKKEVFPQYKIGIMHSKMKPDVKESVMNKFLSHEIDILIATSVIEVGVNVPNASIILIEHAERYGLSQLHQLRGRVIRGNHQAYCYLMTNVESEKSQDRLKAIEKAKNGFELAELDLSLRGVGELYGDKQWGVSDIAMDAIQNLKLVSLARESAREIISADIELYTFPLLRAFLSLKRKIHFE